MNFLSDYNVLWCTAQGTHFNLRDAYCLGSNNKRENSIDSNISFIFIVDLPEYVCQNTTSRRWCFAAWNFVYN